MVNLAPVAQQFQNIIDLCDCDKSLFNDGIEEDIKACARNGLKNLAIYRGKNGQKNNKKP